MDLSSKKGRLKLGFYGLRFGLKDIKMEQLTLEKMSEGQLPDGTQLNVGDIIHYSIANMVGITRVILYEGKLCMEQNFMYGSNTAIDHFIRQASYNEVKKLSLKELYLLCKKCKWDTGYYIKKFGKKTN